MFFIVPEASNPKHAARWSKIPLRFCPFVGELPQVGASSQISASEQYRGLTSPSGPAAQRLSQQAQGKIGAAQQANKWDMQGHAQKAKELPD
jgi:hypothetical protein